VGHARRPGACSRPRSPWSASTASGSTTIPSPATGWGPSGSRGRPRSRSICWRCKPPC